MLQERQLRVHTGHYAARRWMRTNCRRTTLQPGRAITQEKGGRGSSKPSLCQQCQNWDLNPSLPRKVTYLLVIKDCASPLVCGEGTVHWAVGVSGSGLIRDGLWMLGGLGMIGVGWVGHVERDDMGWGVRGVWGVWGLGRLRSVKEGWGQGGRDGSGWVGVGSEMGVGVVRGRVSSPLPHGRGMGHSLSGAARLGICLGSVRLFVLNGVTLVPDCLAKRWLQVWL